MPKRIKGQILYKGYLSPSPGKISKKKRTLLAKVYSACRHKNPGEIKSRKTKCSKIAWSVVNKSKSKKSNKKSKRKLI